MPNVSVMLTFRACDRDAILAAPQRHDDHDATTADA